MTTRHDTAFAIGPDHLALPGHFPGRPVVPGVVLLDQVIAAARAAFGLPAATALTRAKFPAAVLPGDTVAVALTRLDATRVGFACSVAGKPVASGECRFGP